jgi:tryptophan-rich sensory protein
MSIYVIGSSCAFSKESVMNKSFWREILLLLTSIVICQFTGFIGSLATTPNILTWYTTITKPSFTPPNWIFFPVWVSLYLLMGISAYLIWRHGLRAKGTKSALLLFLIQLILNGFWSFAFFGLHSPLFGGVIIVLLWLAILATVVAFFRRSLPAGILLLPYILWVTFAGILNWSIYILNH